MQDVTFVIKSFNRYKSLIKLLFSIEEHHPSIDVVLLDDGCFRNYNSNRIMKIGFNLRIIILKADFDIGLSAGRNRLVKEVTTPYLILLDDDFLLPQKLPIMHAIELLESGYDFISGPVIDYFSVNSIYSIFMLLKPRNFFSWLKKQPVNVVETFSILTENSVKEVDWINNFFITKKSTLDKLGGWIPESLKIYEHGLFKIRLRLGNYRLGYFEEFKIHSFRYLPLIYIPFRYRPKRKYNRIRREFLLKIKDSPK
jgi:GT2 family glycosyltransferase